MKPVFVYHCAQCGARRELDRKSYSSLCGKCGAIKGRETARKNADMADAEIERILNEGDKKTWNLEPTWRPRSGN